MLSQTLVIISSISARIIEVLSDILSQSPLIIPTISCQIIPVLALISFQILLIVSDRGVVKILAIQTNEELAIAKYTYAIITNGENKIEAKGGAA